MHTHGVFQKMTKTDQSRQNTDLTPLSVCVCVCACVCVRVCVSMYVYHVENKVHIIRDRGAHDDIVILQYYTLERGGGGGKEEQTGVEWRDS